MHGALAHRNGILYVGRHAKTAGVRCYDLDGHALDGGFDFRDGSGRSSVSGLAVDEDHRVWVADEPAGRVRLFTLFGRELLTVGGGPEEREDRVGSLGRPVDVAVCGIDDELELVVGSAGTRRHALQVFHPESGRVRSLRPGGDPQGRFRDLRGIAAAGRLVYASEARPGRVQVFRDGDFHFRFGVRASGARAEPSAVAPLGDGRVVVAVGGETSALLLYDGAGRLLRPLADAGPSSGEVVQPADVVVAEGASDRATRVAVIDRDGERVQVFALDGRCYGAFADRVGG